MPSTSLFEVYVMPNHSVWELSEPKAHQRVQKCLWRAMMSVNPSEIVRYSKVTDCSLSEKYYPIRQDVSSVGTDWRVVIVLNLIE